MSGEPLESENVGREERQRGEDEPRRIDIANATINWIVVGCTRGAGVVYPRPCLRFKSAARKDGYAAARSRNLPTCEYSG